jgi:DNA replication protein DnaC
MTTTTPEPETLRNRLQRLGLYGLLTQVDEIREEDWLPRLLDIEEAERKRRSLERRLKNARIGSFKPMADFDWDWPETIDRQLIDELFHLAFVEEAANVVLLGSNGLGKTMIAKNLAHQAILRGFTARFTTASDMLHDLAAQDSDASLGRRLRRYTQPQLLAVDEVGYLAYDTRYADLLFEVVTRRYQTNSIVLTTNKVFGEWNDVFPNAACVVTLIDRLVHKAEIASIEGESYRLKEAKERAALKAKTRARRRRTKPK